MRKPKEGYDWLECVCAEIDPLDLPCLSCAVKGCAVGGCERDVVAHFEFLWNCAEHYGRIVRQGEKVVRTR